MPIRQVEKLGLGDLLGSLLTAVVEAQQHATRSSLDIVQQVGLIGEGDEERLRTVTFRYTKLDEKQQPAEFEIEMPLLAMVSIPTLAVKDATIAFSYDVMESVSAQEETGAGGGGAILSEFASRPAVLRGIVRRSGSSESRESTSVDVNVTIEQAALPLGLERMFDLAELAMNERPVAEEE